MNSNFESIATADRPRDYAGLLWILVAGALGFSLFCGTSAIALSDQTLPTPIVIEREDIADLAFSNLNTAAALTAQSFAEIVATVTPTASFTHTSTITSSPTFTSTPTRTPFIPTITPTAEKQKPSVVQPTSTRVPPPTPIVVQGFTGTPSLPDAPTETPEPQQTDPPTNPPPTDPPPPST